MTAPTVSIDEDRSETTLPLRRLYFVRFAFAVVWAVLVFTTAKTLGPVATTLLVLYPLFDVAAAVVDARSAKTATAGLYVNIVISLLTAVGLGIAASSGIPAVLGVWGAWAIVAGLVQLVVGLVRRSLGGQWPMIASGALSAVAGTTFVLQSTQDAATLTTLAGYATLGGVFFLISALRLGRSVKR
ncbi:hypothetical protein VSH64_20895 [Amycolatopsis rhabdoformis]|uniref:DUF308 domain-containing protein n=1 Tax=Amycolatopsis rhabdoformis TaxID=1448059 RepID=A0ABZ1IKX0_9PSEU|nr:hypothetical protein [Amycolatopsis rhabdoformis]WSE34511.1 hypothetical protein VSH64_20895 [Amycolatopsis rhabdoformis]